MNGQGCMRPSHREVKSLCCVFALGHCSRTGTAPPAGLMMASLPRDKSARSIGVLSWLESGPGINDRLDPQLRPAYHSAVLRLASTRKVHGPRA